MFRTISLLSQEDVVALDSLLRQPVIVVKDTSALKRISGDAIDAQVVYSAPGGRIINDVINKRSTMVKNAQVSYKDIEIKADSIIFNMSTNEVFAVGIKDSTGKVVGKPQFKSGSEEFQSDTLRYNFKTKQAIVKNIVTKQEEGLLHSQVTKLLTDGTSNIFKSTYSTCEADTPHFYINLPRAKVYPGKKIISGPGNLVLEGIPLPLYLPFGFFPIQTKKAASGILIPKVHYEAGRGYALTEGGYYFAINEHFDLTMKGSIFTNGSWLVNGQTSYNKRYRYSGSLSFSYANNISGHKGLPDESISKNYSLGWTYNQDAKARPGSRFAASVNMSSSNYDRNNSYDLESHITTTRQSSISYSKTWTGSPVSFSASMNHNQNVKTNVVSLNLPKIDFGVSRIYPLKSRNQNGPTKWWQELQMQYTAQLDNQINTKDSLLFTSAVWNNMRSGFRHTIPVSLQIRPFNNFSISPSLTYTGVLYTRKIEPIWNPDLQAVIRDTITGFFYGQALNPSISAGYSPQIFGIYDFTSPDSRIDAIRHVMKPSISFGFVPSLRGLSSDMYRQVQFDTLGSTRDYSIFEGSIYGTPSLSRKSGNISFGLTNILEAKVFQRNDTTGKARKVNIIDNFGINTAYNIFADSLRWSPISMVMRTTLFKNIDVSANASFSLYGFNSQGGQTGTFYWTQKKKLMRLNQFAVSLNFSVSELLQGKDEKKSQPAAVQQRSGINPADMRNSSITESAPFEAADASSSLYDEYGYQKFDAPWTMDVSYSLSCFRTALKSTISQTLTMRGQVKLTRNMDINYTTGYDFAAKEITMTQIMITRNLHCWNMNFSWVPNGNMKMWEFSIRVNASILQDLKYERRKDYHDNY